VENPFIDLCALLAKQTWERKEPGRGERILKQLVRDQKPSVHVDTCR
jgi:hypothetical protein